MKKFKPKLLAANDIIGIYEVDDIITDDLYTMDDFIDSLPDLDNSQTIYSLFTDKKMFDILSKNYGVITL